MAPATPPPSPSPRELGLQVLQRDWLSANQIVFAATAESPATVVDTGHARHAELTLALIAHALGGAPLQRILNTHLHSDHCGGNWALQMASAPAAGAATAWEADSSADTAANSSARSPLQTLVPAASLPAVQAWDAARLSYQPTGQSCPRFQAHGALQPGSHWRLGPADWQVLAAPGHDPDAVMLFEPQTRTLISGDALWQDRLAILFPELEGRPGFEPALATLALIEQLAPRWVIPGHGEPFDDAGSAIAASRARLHAYAAQPERHLKHAARALAMFHIMEQGAQPRPAFAHWLAQTPLFRSMAQQLGASSESAVAAWAASLLDQLLADGLLHAEGEMLRQAPAH